MRWRSCWLTMLFACGLPSLGSAQNAVGLPQPRLHSVFPVGIKAGSSIEITCTGLDMNDVQTLLTGHPGLKADFLPEPTPMPDPKKPAPPPKVNATSARFKLTAAADVPVGTYDLRVVSKWGVSNSRFLAVGHLPELVEKEPNDDVSQAQRVELNCSISGLINQPTDVDYFVFAGKKGQRVLLAVQAGSLDSRSRPAVELYDATGKRLAFARNYAGTDALADITLPADSDYHIRLYEFTHTRGGPESWYRLTLSTGPWIDAVYPPVVRPGQPAQVTLLGRNLPGGQPDPAARIDGLTLDRLEVTITPPADPDAAQQLTYRGLIEPHVSGSDGFEYRFQGPNGISNPVLIGLARAPVVLEQPNNDSKEQAQPVTLPCEVAGRIDRRSDRDWFRFSLKKDETVWIELTGNRLHSVADLYFQICDAKGGLLGEFDDSDQPIHILHPRQFYTRHFDPPAIPFKAAADGEYFIMVSSREAGVQFSPRHSYSLRISPAQPDFRLIVMPPEDAKPDAAVIRADGQESLTVFVWRRDGFNGPITLTADGLPPGVTCPPQTIASGQNLGILVLSAGPGTAEGQSRVTVRGTAAINGQSVVRVARPATIIREVQRNQNTPAFARLDPTLWLAVRDQALFRVSAALDKPAYAVGDKGNVVVTVTRLKPDLKVPIQVTGISLPANVTLNNNQGFTIAADKNDGQLVLDVKANALPGVYSLIVRGSATFPFTGRDPAGKNKQNVTVVLPSLPVSFTITPKALAKLSTPTPTATVKIGGQVEWVLKVERQFNYDGAFDVKVMLPPNVPNVSVTPAPIPAGANEIKLLVKADATASPSTVNNITVQAIGTFNGTIPISHELKFNLNVVK